MDKLKKIQIAKVSFGFSYFLLATVLIQILPEIICAVQMLESGAGLTQETVLLIRVVSYIVSIPFFYLALSSVLNQRGEQQFCRITVFVRAYLWLTAWLVSFITMTDLMFDKGTLFKNLIQKDTHLYLIVVAAVCIAEVIVGTYLLYYIGFVLSPTGRTKGGLRAFQYFVTHPLCILECLGFFLLFGAAYEGIPYLFEKLPMKLSFVSRMIPLLILSVVESLILYCFYLREENRLYKYSVKKQNRETMSEEQETEATESEVTESEVTESEATGFEKPKPEATKLEEIAPEEVEEKESGKPKKKITAAFVSFVLALAVMAGFLIADKIAYQKKTDADAIIEDIDKQMLCGERSLLNGDLDQALVYYRNASARAKAWIAVLEDDDDTLISLAQEYSSDTQITYLYLMTREDTVELENFLRSDAIGYIWCQNLLTRYQQLKYNNLTDKQEGLKKEAIAICIANGYYIDESIHPDEIDKKKNLIHQLKEFDEIDLYADMLEQVVEVGREGTLTQDMVNRFLDIAEENPDVFICQYLAYVMGTSYLEDNASHYERTVEVIKVYDKLFEKEDVTEEQRKAEKLDVASGCMKCKDYETALSYLEEAADLGVGENVDMLIMQCYAKLDETEKCYKYAKNILEEYPDNLSALYYASTESLKQENIDESLEYAITLAEQVAETENNYDAEILLFQYAQFMVISDDSYWTDYQYAQYKNLTEEQWDKINESPLLGDYLNGLYYTFGDKDYETAASYADAILEVNDAYPQANYMRAVIAYQQEEFADAVTYYKKSLSIEDDSANAWFGLANAYDALEEYDLAYQCCQKVAALKPYMDHDSSWYGVSYHNNSLMNSLKEYVEDER